MTKHHKNIANFIEKQYTRNKTWHFSIRMCVYCGKITLSLLQHKKSKLTINNTLPD